MTEEEKRQHRACFTGHRPEKLTISESDAKAWLYEAIQSAIADGHTTFISGMARGVDIWAAEVVLSIRDNVQADAYRNIKLICASPYEGFERSWSENWQMRYRHIMDSCDLKKFICSHYSKSCFQIRNKWMVDHSHIVIAVYNGEKGGTKNTIDYAEKQGLEVRYIEG